MKQKQWRVADFFEQIGRGLILLPVSPEQAAIILHEIPNKALRRSPRCRACLHPGKQVLFLSLPPKEQS